MDAPSLEVAKVGRSSEQPGIAEDSTHGGGVELDGLKGPFQSKPF